MVPARRPTGPRNCGRRTVDGLATEVAHVRSTSTSKAAVRRKDHSSVAAMFGDATASPVMHGPGAGQTSSTARNPLQTPPTPRYDGRCAAPTPSTVGQRQHVALARVLFTDRPLVLLDEPSAHLVSSTPSRCPPAARPSRRRAPGRGQNRLRPHLGHGDALRHRGARPPRRRGGAGPTRRRSRRRSDRC